MLKRMFTFFAKEPEEAPRVSLDTYCTLLDPALRPFAQTFFERFSLILPQGFELTWDTKAPDNPDLLDEAAGNASRLSLEVRLDHGGHPLKFGTGRVALRDKYLFAKTVTWRTPKDFLRQLAVYQLIKEHYGDCTIQPNRSKSHSGFLIHNRNQIITLEVFGENESNGFLACDITLSRFNPDLAQQRAFRFLNFYGCLYNHLGQQDLHFATEPPLEVVEFPEIQAYQE